MSEQKNHQFRPPLYHQDSAKATRAAGPRGTDSLEQQGWEAYRKWLTRVSSKPAGRATVDHSIYSWKGYNSWAERIRESWKNDESENN